MTQLSHSGLSSEQSRFLSTSMCSVGAEDPNSGPCAYTGTEPFLQSLKGCKRRKKSVARKGRAVRFAHCQRPDLTQPRAPLPVLPAGRGVRLLCRSEGLGGSWSARSPGLRADGADGQGAGRKAARPGLLGTLAPRACPGGGGPAESRESGRQGAEWAQLPFQSCLMRAEEGGFERET